MIKINVEAQGALFMKLLGFKFSGKISPQILFGLIGGISLVAFAITPRKVTVPAHATSSSGSASSGVTLFNGSSSPVTYKVTCYDKTGTLQFGPNTHTLNSKAKVVHGETPKCQGNSYDSYIGKYANGMMNCGWTSSPTVSSCPTNYHLCSFSEVQANAGTDTSGRRGWVGSGFSFSVSANWSIGYSSNSSMSYQNYSSYSPEVPVPVADSTKYCFSGANGTGNQQQFCTSIYNGDWRGNFCCPNTGAEKSAHSCDVEITDPTPASGYLQSPDFKANAPF